nr:MAG TPA: hypothetical protein [Caudoviricetes sp.]
MPANFFVHDRQPCSGVASASGRGCLNFYRRDGY